MKFRMVLVAMMAAMHAHSASETTSSPGDPLHWNSITRSWECTSLNPCAEQPDLAEAKDEKVLWEAKTNEASTKATMKAKVIAAQAENEKALKAVKHAEAAVGRHKSKGVKNPAGAGIMLLQAQTGAAFGSGYEELGPGHCNSGYVGGWDGHADTLQACNAKCDQDTNCKFVSFSQGRTCSRYGAGTDCVDRPHGQNDHVSYKKLEDDPLHFNPAQSDPASPLSNETSICREWYISDGPVKHGSNKAAADALKSAADGTWSKGTEDRKGSPPTTKGLTTDGTGWAVGFKHGCTEVTNGNGVVFTICGCYEIWCPVRMHCLSHPDDIYGRDASGVDGSMAVRTTCYSARAVFGCYNDNGWVDNCGWQLDGLYQPGSGINDGQFMRAWEQLVL